MNKEEDMSILTDIQTELKAPKNRFNRFGNYKYRSCEDILEAVKPLLKEHKATLTIRDEIVEVGGRVYVKAIVTFNAGDENAEVTAFARESESKKGMDDSQITGTASSYARKYALNGLFLIDDTKDADTEEFTQQSKDAEKTQETAAKKIGKVKAEALAKAVADCGKDLNVLLNYLGVKKAEDLTEEQHLAIMKKVEEDGNHRKG